MEQFKRVYITQDYDGHDFIIPYELKDEFNTLVEKAYATEDFDEFNEKFDKYATGGSIDLVELYIKI